ncbi:hypothetical protein [Maribacter sp. 2308TA10-17]|uniref:hypothetical protein n=1 Tax=Maribacter sp. 2308TA10-17 TaxID=3386276 RepID=UPI0039BC9929
MDKKIISFALQLFGVLVFLVLLHMAFFYARGIAIPFDLIALGYLANFAMAFVIYYVMVELAKKQNKNLGFVFLFGSTLKFAVYFLIFNPLFMQDNSLSKLEFFTFFVPYITCLIVETLALVKLLKDID